MSDRHSKLMALAGKRKQATQDPTSSDEEKLSSKKTKRNVKPKKYVSVKDSDDEDDDEEEEEDEDDEEVEEVESDLSDDDEAVVKQKRSVKPKSKKVKKAKKTQGSDDEGSDEGKDGISEDELQVLDTKLIIPGGRRTRGKKIDYKQFGADPEDEE